MSPFCTVVKTGLLAAAQSPLGRLDWGILAGFILLLIGLAAYAARFMHTVTDFLAASRLAGRYLLTVSRGLGGAISMIALWEMTYAGGLPTQWWDMMIVPVVLLVSLTGFIVYRFRQTRALTLAQFFEMRYSRRFRMFAGLLSWVSGVFNYGLFPAISARFIATVLGLPETVMLGPLNCPTVPLVMAGYLSIALYSVLSGGQIAVLLTDLFQGVVSFIVITAMTFYFLIHFEWSAIIAGLQTAPAGHSLINPFQSTSSSDFGFSYFAIAIFAQIYNARSWQGNSGSNAAARTPHEARMAGILGSWRELIQKISLLVFPLAAFAVLHHAQFSDIAAPILKDLNNIADDQTRQQMTVPLFLQHMLPAGLLGLFATAVVASAISCDNSYLHSWGTILVQDVILPLKKKPFSPAAHLRVLRLSIIGVAAFGFLFSLLVPLKQFVLMYFALTGAIYLGGAGAVIIGGLYWSRGTTTAAWVAMIAGSVLAFGGLAIIHFWSPVIVDGLTRAFPHWEWLSRHATRFPLSGQVVYFIAMGTASLLYVVVSLCGRGPRHDMDRLLNRATGPTTAPAVRLGWKEKLGLDRSFSASERWIFLVTLGWSASWFLIFLGGTLLNRVWPQPDSAWSTFWWIKVWLSVALAAGFCTWFIVGGLKDAIRLLRDLRHSKNHGDDDGSVSAPASRKD